ncbi:uncharacterized protein TNCT_727511 [Trichonephila clavata]|uniref:Uncharacterized protein n=1 Tax=Trichonephila clavata TaxID=2740835 RepID=A0A8X6FMH9_TRICU|nr:uncharacterized protein TNCT_727511 [Trichonephila clavata]
MKTYAGMQSDVSILENDRRNLLKLKYDKNKYKFRRPGLETRAHRGEMIRAEGCLLKWAIHYISFTVPTLVNPMEQFELIVPAEEAIFIERPKVTFSIHSPYLLDNNTLFKDKLNLGSSYDINIRLEEERFLPSPFLTDCMDYNALWEANGKNGPRSQMECKDWCWEPYYEICEGCDDDLQVFEKPEICTRGPEEIQKEELFGYIGGLMGCWLGISVFSCVDFFEKIWYCVRLKWKLRSKFKAIVAIQTK